MSYPADPLDIVVEIAPGADPQSDPGGYDWVDISDRWRAGDNPGGPITISRGKSSPLSDTVPSQCSLTLDNSDGRFASRNPISPYYPDLARNTPLRVRLRQFHDTFTRTGSSGWGTPDSGPVWSTSGGAASDYSTDGASGVHTVTTVNVTRESAADVNLATVDVTVTGVSVSAAPTGAAIHHAIVARYDASNFVDLRVFRPTAGAPTVAIRQLVGGVETFDGFPSVSGATNTSVLSMRLQAVGSVLRGKVWVDGDPQPAEWMVEITGTLLDAGDVAIRTLAESGNTNGTFTARYGSIDISSTRFTGYVDKWPPRWDPSGNNRWVPVVAHGVLRRISTAGDATRSALYRYLTEQAWARTAYWPMEDGANATEAASAESLEGPMSPSAPVRFGQAAPAASGVSTMVDTSGAYLHARTRRWYAPVWRLEVVVAHSTVPTGTVRVLSWLCTGSVTRWDLNATSTGFQLVAWSAVTGGTTFFTINTGVSAQPNQLHHLRVDVEWTTNVTATIYVDGVNCGTATAVAQTALIPNVMRVNPDANDTDNMPLVGHLIMWAEHPAGSTSDQAALGYPGEQARERIAAICSERSVPYAPYPGSLVSDTMGARLSGSLVAQLREAETTDAGILYELTTGHLSYRPRSTLYNQDVRLTLDYEQGHIAPPFLPSDDDAQLRNDVAARRPAGSEYRYTDAEHIAAVGRYEVPLTVNPESDETLPQLAAWAVHRGTVAEQRFDNIATSMYRASELIGDWLAADIGDRIQVDNVPTHLTPDAVDVILAGYTEVLQYPQVWRVEMVCEPASAWTVGELDDDVLGRLDTAGSTISTGDFSAGARGNSSADYLVVLDADAASFAVGQQVVILDPNGRRKRPTVHEITNKVSAFGFTNLFLDPAPEDPVSGNLPASLDRIARVDTTTLTVATSTGPVWTTNGAHVPFDVNVNGERMTVTAVSGASSPQTFTVTRSVNGVQKPALSGTAVRLWQPLILGL